MSSMLVLIVHLVVIAFNLFGLIMIPIGGRRGWLWVREPLWRTLHLFSLAVVAVQAALGRPCFLTLWQDRLSGAGHSGPPLIVRWVNMLIYWRLPLWVFTCLYFGIFLYAVALIWWVSPRWYRRKR